MRVSAGLVKMCCSDFTLNVREPVRAAQYLGFTNHTMKAL